MLFPRTKLVDALIQKIETDEPSVVILHGSHGAGKTTFLKLLENAGVLNPRKTEHVRTDFHEHETRLHDPEWIVIDASITVQLSEVRAFIKSKLPHTKILFLCEKYPEDMTEDEDILIYEIPYLSFREFAEGHHHSIQISEILENQGQIERLNELREMYVHLGQFGEHLSKGENTHREFDEIMLRMKEHLFDKEHDQFLEFSRTLAMNVSELFKEEKIAKQMGISRRKVRKYAEILAKHQVIRAVGPYYKNTDVELSRHVKIYFRDLSYMDTLLGVGYFHGESRQGVIENFVLLELERKLKNTHTIYFYRKKSGADVHFVLEENDSRKITPIEVSLRSSGTISQALKSFNESYNEMVDHYMILNERVGGKDNLGDKPLIILPHVAI